MVPELPGVDGEGDGDGDGEVDDGDEDSGGVRLGES